MRILCREFTADDGGVTSIEYALIATLIGMAMIAAARLIGLDLANVFTTVSGFL